MGESGKKSCWQEHGSGMYSIEVPFQNLDLVGKRILEWAKTTEVEGIRQVIGSARLPATDKASEPGQRKTEV